MTKEQECIAELYSLINKLTEKAIKKDLSLIRAAGAGGCDMYQGMPPICRIRDGILKKYKDVIYRQNNDGNMNDFLKTGLQECKGQTYITSIPIVEFDNVQTLSEFVEAANKAGIGASLHNERSNFAQGILVQIYDKEECKVKDCL